MSEQLYILGHPVAHSKSPAMHNAAYDALGLAWRYGFMDCPSEDEARAFLAQQDWFALNITMPYKPLALARSTSSSVEAQLAGGANVLARRGVELLSDNTDGKGCVSYLKRCGVVFEDARVIVCGTGPTSLAIMHAAAQAGARKVTLLGRDAGKADRVLVGYLEHASQRGVEFAAGAYNSSADAIAEAQVILDATPLGMKAGDPAPFDTALLNADQAVFDVVYGHGQTALLAAARAAGCATYDGAGMLVAQAVETVYDLARWHDIPLDSSVDLYAVMAEAAGFSQ